MPSPNQRIEEVIILSGAEDGPASHVAATKMRFYNDDGTPFALKGADNKARLDALEARVAALEGNEPAEEEPVVEGEEPAVDEPPAENPAEAQQ